MAITALFGAAKIGMGMKSFISGGAKLGSSVLGAAKNTAVGVKKTAQSLVPQKKEEKGNKFVGNYTSFFGSKKTEKILRKNLKLLRDSLVNTFEIARYLKAAIIDITKGLKGGGKGGLFGGLGGMFGMLGGIVGIFSGLFALLTNPWIAAILAGTLFLNKDVRDAIIGFMRPIIVSIAKALYKDSIFRGWWGEGDLDAMGKRVNESVEDIGGARTLAVLKEEEKRLAALHEENKGFFGGSDYKKDLNAVRKQIKRLESSGVVASTDAAQTVEDLGDFQERGKVREDLQSNMEMELEAVKAATFKEMINQLPEELRGLAGFKLNKEGKVVMDPSANFKRTKLEFKANTLFDEEAKAKLNQLAQWQMDFANESGKRQNVIRNKYDEKISGTTLESVNKEQNVEGVQSDLNSLDFSKLYDDKSLNESKFSFAPIAFNNSQAQDSSGGITNTSGGNSPSGNSVTFYSSSSSDPSYHKLNALVTFNIV